MAHANLASSGVSGENSGPKTSIANRTARRARRIAGVGGIDAAIAFSDLAGAMSVSAAAANVLRSSQTSADRTTERGVRGAFRESP